MSYIRVKKYFKTGIFYPGTIAFLTTPFYFARKGLFNGVKEFALELTGDLLDVGCGTKPYQELFDVNRYVGLEIDTEASRKKGVSDYFYDGVTFPFADNIFDSVLCNQVLEHVFTPDEFLTEINRVLKDGGKLLLTAPFVWDEHEQPFDYARYSSFGLKALLERNGFYIIRHKKLGADFTIVFQLINAYLFKVTQTCPRLINIIFRIMLVTPINLLGIAAGRLFPKNPDLYLDHIILARKNDPI